MARLFYTQRLLNKTTNTFYLSFCQQKKLRADLHEICREGNTCPNVEVIILMMVPPGKRSEK